MIALPLALAFLQLSAVSAHVSDAPVYDGRASQLQVHAPRIDARATIDGRLDEDAWRRAATLTGFSEYSPVDGRPADDSTEVLIWYSPTAIYFGIRAFERHGPVHATLAQRDRIDADDYVQIFLNTFNNTRQAVVFGVNPLGVQSDGVLIEGSGKGGNGFSGIVQGMDAIDLSPDYVLQSKGRVTDTGYEVEIRIPFKSLRYQAQREQTWRINVVRRVQHSGHQQSWTPARQAAASFLAQSGSLVELTGLNRGLVLDVNPELTAKATGAAHGDGWSYHGERPQLGGNVRWGVTNDLTLNATVKPDFSQVEADAGQLSYDPRQALYFSEKRPFFLDGIEQFAVPNQLIYTRRIVQPTGAVKLTGKAAGTSIAFLSAVDDPSTSPTGDHPIYNLLRVQRDLGNSSKLGLVYTDRMDGASFNRVGGVDARLVAGSIYTVALQGAASITRGGGVSEHAAPLWTVSASRSGRTFAAHYSLTGIHDDFRAASGFISRPGVADAVVDHQVTFYGPKGGPLESVSLDVQASGTWKYQRFVHGKSAEDERLHFNNSVRLRGGWTAGASVLVESYGYDPALYATYAVERHLASGVIDTIPFTGTPRIPNLDYVASLNTPQYKHFDANLFAIWGHDENFFEWASANILVLTLGANWRPTEQWRIGATYNEQRYARRTDGSVVGVTRIPRLKIEYQLSRSIFMRAVGQYASSVQDSLRDDSRTNDPLLIRNPDGTYARASAATSNIFRVDWLFSYQPVPGTVLFAGYGNTLTEPEPLRMSDLRRTDDGFFLKLSYLFRI